MEIDKLIAKNEKNRAIFSIIVDVLFIPFMYWYFPYEPQYNIPIYYSMFYFVFAFIIMDLLESVVRLYFVYHPVKKLHNSEQELFEEAISKKEIYDDLPKIENEILTDSPLFDEDGLGCYSCENMVLGVKKNSRISLARCNHCKHLDPTMPCETLKSNYKRVK